MQAYLPFLLYLLLICRCASAKVEWLPDTLQEVYHLEGGFYSYAPTVVRDGAAEQVWFCRNLQARVIRDHIFHFERRDGTNGPAQIALSPGPDTHWDRFHICDPSIVEGKFLLDAVPYRYALFYLGNNIDKSANNEIGVAFANNPGGEWHRYGHPIIAWPQNGDWGVGQPSAINREGNGRILLFYTKGTRRGTVALLRELDMTDMAHPKVGSEKKVPLGGLKQSDGQPDWLNNFDVAYAPGRDRFYAVREQHPNPGSVPRMIPAQVELVSIAAADLGRADGQWQVESAIGPELSGFPRNHNPALERTWRGLLPDEGRLKVMFSVSRTGPDFLWTYALWEVCGKLANTPRLGQ